MFDCRNFNKSDPMDTAYCYNNVHTVIHTKCSNQYHCYTFFEYSVAFVSEMYVIVLNYNLYYVTISIFRSMYMWLLLNCNLFRYYINI